MDLVPFHSIFSSAHLAFNGYEYISICTYTHIYFCRGMYVLHMVPWVFGDTDDKLTLSSFKLIDGDIATATVLISFGAVLGRTNPAQLLVMAFIELVFWSLNFYVCVSKLGIVDVGGSIVVHSFGAYFGLAVSYIIGKPRKEKENKSMYHSDVFSMIGTLFLVEHNFHSFLNFNIISSVCFSICTNLYFYVLL